MNDWMREVDYATYCPKCKNFKVLETDELQRVPDRVCTGEQQEAREV